MKKNTFSLIGIGFLLIVFFLLGPLLGQSFLFDMDIHNEYVALQTFLKESLSQNESIAWNPYSGLGLPVLADGHMGPYYWPHYFLFAFDRMELGLSYFFLAHLLLAFIGTILFCKHLGLSLRAQLISSVVFTFNGYLMAITSNYFYMLAICYLPLLAFLAGQLREKATVSRCFFLAATLTMQFLTGASPIFFISIVSLSVLFFLIPSQQSYKKSFLYYSLAYIMCACFSSAQLIPTLQYVAQSSMSKGVDYEYMISNSLNPRLLLSLFFPYIYGVIDPNNTIYASSKNETFQGYFDFDELHNYLGLPTLFLILMLALQFRTQTHRYTKALWGLLGFTFILALGENVPGLYRVLVHVPLFNFFKDPAKWSFSFSFAAAILAGISFDQFWPSNSKTGKKSFLAFIFILAVPLGLLILSKFNMLELEWRQVTTFATLPSCDKGTAPWLGCWTANNLSPLFYFFVILVLTCALYVFRKNKFSFPLLVVLIFLDLFIIERTAFPLTTVEFYKKSFPHLETIKKEQPFYRAINGFVPEKNSLNFDYLNGDIAAFHKIHAVATTTPLVTSIYSQLLYATNLQGLEDLSRLTSSEESIFVKNFLNAIAVKYVIEPDSDSKPMVKSRDDAVQRIYFSTEYEIAAHKEEALRVFLKNCMSGSCFKPVLLQSQIKNISESSKSDLNVNYEFLNYKNDFVKIKVETNRPALAVYLDQDYPGWTATLNGQPTPLLIVHGLFKAVFISEPGNHIVEFRFKSQPIQWGIYISLISFFVFGLLALTENKWSKE